jgi:hypothetical protein
MELAQFVLWNVIVFCIGAITGIVLVWLAQRISERGGA